tara:strand:- start:866 stop:1363 length:498 start_codon:yes stop_codon:yes gene_type:complete
MEFDATFWVGISFIIFFVLLIYFKIPNKINDLLSKMILDIKKEISESEKLREESKNLLDKAQKKLDTAEAEKSKIIKDAQEEADRLIIEINEKFHKSSEIKKNLAQSKINQMRENAIFEIKKASVKIAIDSVKQAISTSVDKSKLESLFEKNLNETKEELKKINS